MKHTVYDALLGGLDNGHHGCNEEDASLQLDSAKKAGIDLQAPCSLVTEATLAGGPADDPQWSLCRPLGHFCGPYYPGGGKPQVDYYTLYDCEEHSILIHNGQPVLGWWWCRGEQGMFGPTELENAFDGRYSVIPGMLCDEANMPIKGTNET